MPRNIEIKARIASVEETLRRMAALASDGPRSVQQDDTFFRCENGRLKLRAFRDGSGELIFYQRPDRSGPKESQYLIHGTSAADTLRAVLCAAYPIAGRVRKHRTVFLTGRTRMHLDRVEGLGDFLELEVVLGDDEDPQAGIAEAEEVMARLGVDRSALIEGAYVDLFVPGHASGPSN